ncbi:MAG TPA: hypothetical protein VF721_01300 [Pyrinomonadaceae bacterium]|jgi:hypothetical protein
MDNGSIDFVSVPVANQTGLWLIPFPFPFTQWFPFTPFALANGVLYGVKDQYSGDLYYAEGDTVIVAPEWAAFTENGEDYVILTVYSPGSNRGRQPNAPKTLRFIKRNE